jgi:hypothetical protein
MKRLLLLCLSFIVLSGPASADVYMLPDTAGYDTYQVITPGSGFLMSQYVVIDSPPYNVFVPSQDDVIGAVGFEFTTEDMTNISLPVTFYYNGVAREGNISVTFTNVTNWILCSTSDVTVSLFDSYGELCSTTFGAVGDVSVSVLFTRNTVSVGRYGGMLSAGLDEGILPCDYIAFDFEDITTASSQALITVNDDVYYSGIDRELDGMFGWIYRRIDFVFADDDMGIFYLFSFFNSIWNAGIFVAHFVTSCFWFCVMLVEVLALGWAVMSRTLSKAIERYIKMHYYAVLLPFTIFKVFVNIILSVFRTIGEYIPFT